MTIRWVFVATAVAGAAQRLPVDVVKPLATYFGLAMESRPGWWLVLSSLLATLFVGVAMAALRRQGAPVAVFWAAVILVGLSLAGTAALSLATASWPADDAAALWQSALSFPQWILHSGLLVGAAYACARMTPSPETGIQPPRRGWLVVSWLWIGFAVITAYLGMWALVQAGQMYNEIPW